MEKNDAGVYYRGMHTHHHAILFEGDTTQALKAAERYIKDILGITMQQNPDVVHFILERFTIEHARELKEQAAQTPLGSARVFIIKTTSILGEAQNALLKLFEEPSSRSHFVIILPNASQLLPTVRSRLLHAGTFTQQERQLERAELFLSSTIGERIEMVEDIIKNKDRTTARELIHEIEHALHSKGVTNNVESLKDVALASQYILDTSSSVKHVVLHIATTV